MHFPVELSASTIFNEKILYSALKILIQSAITFIYLLIGYRMHQYFSMIIR